jgi:hypothetical protein
VLRNAKFTAPLGDGLGAAKGFDWFPFASVRHWITIPRGALTPRAALGDMIRLPCVATLDTLPIHGSAFAFVTTGYYFFYAQDFPRFL